MTYSNRSVIRLPEKNLGGSKFNLDFLILVRKNPFLEILYLGGFIHISEYGRV